MSLSTTRLAHSPDVGASLKPGLKLQLPDPAFSRPVEGSNQIELCYDKAEQVDSQPRACAEHRITYAGTKYGRLVRVVPRDPSVSKDRELDWEDTVVPRTDSEYAEKRETKLCVSYGYAAPQQLVEDWTRVGVRRSRNALRSAERSVAVASNQSWLAQEQRL
jgi:hypothetical protein